MRLIPHFPRTAATLASTLFVVAACTSEKQPTSLFAPPVKPSRTLSVPSSGTWAAAGPGTVTLLNDGSTGNPSMSYALSGSVVWSTQTWSFSSTAATTGAISVNWTYSGFHAFYQVIAFIHPFVVHNSFKSYLAGNNYGPANCCSAPSNGFNYTGSTTFNVAAGDSYGFEVGGRNFDSDSRLLGTLTVVFPDNTPPVVVPTITGTLGNNGWYTSDVGVTWSVTDPESAISSSTGCGASTLTTDSNGTTYTCTATSAGGTTTQSVTVMRDATLPIVAYAGNAGTYTVDQQVNITCSASDAMSGLASSSCPGASGQAWTFGLGAHTLTATAQDNAGNTNGASTTFTVQVTAASLCALVRQWESKAGVANAMCHQLTEGEGDDFSELVHAQSGKSISAANANTLLSLWQALAPTKEHKENQDGKDGKHSKDGHDGGDGE